MIGTQERTRNIEDRIRSILRSRERFTASDEPDLVRAAILFLLFRKEGEVWVLFTKRTESVGTHKGEISFPGGRHDPEDGNLESTSLREAYEELGILEKDVDILGTLDDIVTITDFIITPFVASIPYPYEFKVNEGEIERLIEIPLRMFLEKERHRVDGNYFNRGSPYEVHYFDVGSEVVWGATAKIVKNFIDLVWEGKELKGKDRNGSL